MDLKTLQKRIDKLNLNNLFKKIFNLRDVKDFVIERNQEQLYNSGIDATGKKIKTYFANSPNVYSHTTINYKRVKGQSDTIVTLKDTGAFYDTFKVSAENEYAELTANFEVHGESIAENLDITNVLGLTDENKKILIDYIKPLFLKEFKSEVLK